MSGRHVVLDTVVAMQRLADCVRRGYRWFVSGKVKVGRAGCLAEKFESLYGANRHRNARWRSRRQGEAAVVLLLYFLPEADGSAAQALPKGRDALVGWTLLVTDGTNRARHLERLQLATDSDTPLRIGPYELVRRCRSGQSTPAWTYRMSAEMYEGLRSRVIRSARGDHREPLQRLLREIYRYPGFAGIRSQVGKIVGVFRREYRRKHGSLAGFPTLPRLWYVQRLPNTGLLIDHLLERGSVTAASSE